MFSDGVETGGAREALHAALDAAPADAPGPALSEALRSWRILVDVVDGRAAAILPAWEASGEWARDGGRSPAVWLAAHTGMARSAAGGFRRTALDVARHAHLAAAVHAGRLSLAHARELVQARRPDVFAEWDRDEAVLVAEAQALSVDGLKLRLAAWRLRVLEQAARNEEERPPGPLDEADRVSLHAGFGGRGLLEGDLGPESAALLADALDAELDAMRRSGALEGDLASRAELQASALLAIVRRGMDAGSHHGRPRPSVVAVTDLDTLVRRAVDDPVEREARRSELLGRGPVADALIRKLLCDAEVGLVIVDPVGEPLWVGRSRRTATPAQWRALLARSGGHCEMPGCDVEASRCQARHLDEWEHGGGTDLDNLVLLCHHNHQQVHRHGWRLVREDGRWRVHRPDGSEVRTRFHQRPPPRTAAA